MAEVVAQCAAREVRTPTQYVARRMEVLGVARERGRLVGEQTEQSFVPRRTWTRRPEPVGTAATPFSRSSLPSVALPIGRPETFGTFGNTSPLGSAIRTRLVEDGQAASLSGTRCSTAAFMRVAGIVHRAVSTSISFLVAPRTSPLRAAVRTVNRKASFVPAHASVAAMTAKARTTSPYGSARWLPRRCASPRRFGRAAIDSRHPPD